MAEWKSRIVKLEEVDPRLLVENPKNFKIHPETQQEMMGGTLNAIGWIDTVIVNQNTGNMIDGHMRVKLAIEHGEKTVPVIYVDLTKEEEDNALASLDPIGTFAKEEKSKLQELLAGLKPPADMLELIAKVAKKNKINLDDVNNNNNESDKEKNEKKKDAERKEREALRDKWQVEPGKIWRLKSINLDGSYHRLMCGDSSNKSDIDALVGRDRAYLMVTDPPYGVDFEKKYNPRSKEWDAIMGDGLKENGLRKWMADLLILWQQSMYQESAYYLWSAVFREGFAMYDAIEDAGLHTQAQIVWAKNAFSLGQTDYHWQHEICWYAFKLGSKHRWFGGRDQSTRWDITKVSNQKYLHPMQKPVELYKIPIKNHTHAGEICFDPFVGSGTQFDAAESLGRICYGMDNDPVWVATSLQRMYDIGIEPEEV